MNSEPGDCSSIAALIARGAKDAQPVADTIRYFGAESPTVTAAVDLGVPFSAGVSDSQSGLADLRDYRDRVDVRDAAGWMDNTTILTAATLMSESAYAAITPLTVWDLVTFSRAVVSYECLYHHAHPAVDDRAINRLLGQEVLRPLPLPLKSPSESYLPDPWEGPHRYVCGLWEEAYGWMRRLEASQNAQTLDGHELGAVREAWSQALNRPDLQVSDLVDWKGARTSWTSPSDKLLTEIADATAVNATYLYIDPSPAAQELQRRQAELGIKIGARPRQLLTDLNLRAYINQRLADFFGLPYVCGAARVPFRKHLYDRAVAVQHQLATLNVIDDRYAKVAGDVELRLPVFLAVAIRDASEPADLWRALGRLRVAAKRYRAARSELDAALARRDLDQATAVAKALATNVDSVFAVVGGAVTKAGLAVVEEVAKGDVIGIASSVAAVEAASRRLLESSLCDRLMWRLRRPYLLWMNDVMDEAKHLTEALPDFARIWRIPEREQSLFAVRFRTMGALQAASG